MPDPDEPDAAFVEFAAILDRHYPKDDRPIPEKMDQFVRNLRAAGIEVQTGAMVGGVFTPHPTVADSLLHSIARKP